MTTRREFLATGATLAASGAVLTGGLTACTAPAGEPPEPASDKPKVADDTQAFIEVSALLTGLSEPLLNDRRLNDAMAREYARRLRGTFPNEFAALLTAYKGLVAVDSPPKIDDALLQRLRATPEFTKNEIVAKQIVNIWYFSQFNDSTNAVIDGGYYERGYVWPLIKAPPIGFSNERPGYWAVDPAKEAL